MSFSLSFGLIKNGVASEPMWNMDDKKVLGDSNTFQSLFCYALPVHDSHAAYLALPLALNIILVISAIVGNTLILVALNKVTSLHPPSKLLFRCLAITDLLVALVSQPLHIIYLVSTLKVNEQWAKLCLHTAFFAVTISTVLYGVSLSTTAAISVDRLLALLLGMRYRHVVTFKRTLTVEFCVLSLSIILAFASFWKFTIHKSFSYITIILTVSCLLTTTFCYMKIVLTLRQHQNQIREQTNGTKLLPNIARLRKIVYSALLVQVTLGVCYIPNIVVTTIVIFNTSGRSTMLYCAWEFTTILIFFSSSLNPFLYCLKIREVRQAVKSTIRQLWCS